TPRGADQRVPREVRQSILRRRTRVHRRSHRAPRHSPEADPGARDPRDQARPEPAQEPREHPAVTPTSPTPEERRRFDQARERWEKETLRPALARSPERAATFATSTGAPVERLYTPADAADFDYLRDLGFPGEFPYTRGVQPTGYRGRLWTMR